MYKRFLAPFVIFAVAQTAGAAVLTPEAALARAFDGQTSALNKISRQTDPLRLAMTCEARDLPAVYVFTGTSSGRFYVLSADDRTDAVLAYGDRAFDGAGRMPSAAKAWLDGYAAQIAWLRSAESAAEPYKTANVPDSRAPIAPMVSTSWSQSAPYNNLCPTKGAYRCRTGCVATAMAQVMKSHNYPERGTGSHSYDWNGRTLSFDYAATAFDWAAMADVYDDKSSESSQNAVATLMYACGVSVDMDYNPGSSGAFADEIPAAFYKYFAYDRGASVFYRYLYDNFGTTGWDDMVYEQLAENGPVIYSGYDNYEGHTFVCDGYDKDGYFHINWGWAGSSDGYYRLSALTPAASSGGYVYSHNIVANIHRPGEGLDYPPLSCGTSLTTAATSLQLGDVVTVKGAFTVGSAKAYDITPGLCLTAADGSVTYLAAASPLTLSDFQSYDSYDVTLPTSLPEGDYRAEAVFRVGDGVWRRVGMMSDYSQYFTLSVNNRDVTVTPGRRAALTVTDHSFAGPVYARSEFLIRLKLANATGSRYYGRINVFLDNLSGERLGAGDPLFVDVGPAETADVDYHALFTTWYKSVPPEGRYICGVLDYQTGEVLMSEEVDLLTRASGIGDIMVDIPSADAAVYTLDGRRVDAGRPVAPGIYVTSRGKFLVR